MNVIMLTNASFFFSRFNGYTFREAILSKSFRLHSSKSSALQENKLLLVLPLFNLYQYSVTTTGVSLFLEVEEVIIVVGLPLCFFVVYSTRRFVLCLTLCYFVLVFFSSFSIAIISLGEERANLSAFRMFVRFVLVWFCWFPLPLGVWEGLQFVIVGFLGLFS